MAEKKQVKITLTLPENFDGETWDPTLLLIDFLSKINKIPPRLLFDYGPIFPSFTPNGGSFVYTPEHGSYEVETDITLVYNGPPHLCRPQTWIGGK